MSKSKSSNINKTNRDKHECHLNFGYLKSTKELIMFICHEPENMYSPNKQTVRVSDSDINKLLTVLPMEKVAVKDSKVKIHKSKIENEVEEFFNNEDLEQANYELRENITTLEEARYAVIYSINKGFDKEEINDLRTTLLLAD